MIAFALLFALYQLLKAAVYTKIPYQTDLDWIFRDTVMNGPRLLVGSLSLWYAWRRWGKAAIGLHAAGARAALLALGLQLLVLLTRGLDLKLYTPREQLVLGLSSMVVAFNEEALFRALGLRALRERFGERATLYACTLLFTVFHFGAQELAFFPSIFAMGLLYSRLRLDGVSLLWLIFIHGAFDALCYTFGGGPSKAYMLYFPPLHLLVYFAYLKLFRFRENAAHS